MLINYERRRSQGRPISSAGAECAVDYVIGQRMKRNGLMRWSRDGANALLQVRCAVLNGQNVRNFVTVKAIEVADVAKPPVRRQDAQGRWARPLDFSGESVSDGGRRGLFSGSRPLADGLELLDPARRIFGRTHGRVVDALVDIRLTAREQNARAAMPPR